MNDMVCQIRHVSRLTQSARLAVARAKKCPNSGIVEGFPTFRTLTTLASNSVSKRYTRGRCIETLHFAAVELVAWQPGTRSLAENPQLSSRVAAECT